MGCDKCKSKDIQMKQKLNKIRETNEKLLVIIYNINTSLKSSNIFTDVVNFFYSMVKYKKDKIKIL